MFSPATAATFWNASSSRISGAHEPFSRRRFPTAAATFTIRGSTPRAGERQIRRHLDVQQEAAAPDEPLGKVAETHPEADDDVRHLASHDRFDDFG